MPGPVRQFEPRRAVELVNPKYGSGYRIGGGLVLTAAHLLGEVGSGCEVRDKGGFGNNKARVVWKAQGVDIALIELPDEIDTVEPVTLGILPKEKTGETLAFQMYGFPLWGRTRRDRGSAAGGRQVDGKIYLSDRSPDGLLVLEAERLPPEATTAESEWVGASGAAIVCDGLVIAVQCQHQNPYRPASLEATPLEAVDGDVQWWRLLEKHGINCELKKSYLPRTKKFLDIHWHKCSLKILEKQLQLTSNPMTRAENIDYSVEQVYVPLGLVERKYVPRQAGDVSADLGSELYREGQEKEFPQEEEQEVEITRKFEYEEFLEKILLKGLSLNSQGKRVAIIGEPGAGKTTLLQQMARWVSTQFPDSVVIWIPLADLEEGKLKKYVYETWLTSLVEEYSLGKVPDDVINDFIAQCNHGNVWLLLDGLDEMSGAGNLLSEKGWPENTRCILSCRLNLWTSQPLAGFDVFRTLDFKYPQQVEQFVYHWFSLLDKTDLGQELCDALKEPGKERIRDLVKNPLRLTLLCFDWDLKNGRLPNTQAELYQRYVERYYEWAKKKFHTEPEQQLELNKKLAQLSLKAIDGKDEKGKALFRLRERFVKSILKEHFQLALQLGWLNQVGVNANDATQKTFAFYHTTFQEYFASLAIEDWSFFLPHEHRGQPIKDKPYRIFDPQWKQVFLLWMGQEGRVLENIHELKPQKEALIKALLTFKDRCKGFYSDRAFFLAALGIGEFKNCSRADEIVERLMQWKFGSPSRLNRWWIKQFDSFRIYARRDLATKALGSTDIQRAILALVKLLDSTQNKLTLQSAAYSLGQIGMSNEKAIQALVNLLDSTHAQNELILQSAAYSLGQIGIGNKIAIHALTKLLKSTLDESTCRLASKCLGQIDPGNETAIQALIQLLRSTQNESIRQNAAYSLGQIDPGNETAIQALVSLLDSTQDESTRMRAHEYLGQIDPGNETAIQALVSLLDSTQDESTRMLASKCLGQIDPGNETAIQALVSLLTHTQNESTRMLASKCLGQIDPGNETAIQALVSLLTHTQNESTRMRAHEYLGQIDPGNETAIQALVSLLDSTQDESTRMRAHEYLGQIDPGNETAIQALVSLLDSTQDESTFRLAAYNLGQIDPKNEIAIQALVNLLDSTQDESTFRLAAYNLGQIDPKNETAIQALVNLLDSTQDELTFRLAAYNLGQIGKNDEMAIQALVQLLNTPQNVCIRRTTAYCLGQIGKGNEIAIQALVHLLNSNHDEYTILKAAESLELIDAGNEKAILALVELLTSNQNESILKTGAECLGQIGKGNEMAIQALMHLLNFNHDEYTILKAAESLENIDPGNEKTIQALSQLLNSNHDKYIFKSAAKLLGQIDPGNKTAITALTKLLNATQDKSTFKGTASCLGKLKPGNITAIQVLEKLINLTYDKNTFMKAVEYLVQIDPENEKAIWALIKVLNSNLDDFTRSRAAECLRMLEPKNKTATRLMIRILRYPIRQQKIYQLIATCAETLTYPDFHKHLRS